MSPNLSRSRMSNRIGAFPGHAVPATSVCMQRSRDMRSKPTVSSMPDPTALGDGVGVYLDHRDSLPA
jgi:hypothetical protein